MEISNIENKKINFVYEYKTPMGYLPSGFDNRDIGIIFDIISNKEYEYGEFFAHRLGYKDKYSILSEASSTYNFLQLTKDKVLNKCVAELTEDDIENATNVFVIQSMHDETITSYIQNLDITQLFLKSTEKLFKRKNFKLLIIDNKEGGFEHSMYFFEKLYELYKYLKIKRSNQLFYVTNASDIQKRYEKYLYNNKRHNFMKVKSVEFFIYDSVEPTVKYFETTKGQSKNVIYDQNVPYSLPVEDELDVVRDKYFLSLNRNSGRLHRPKLVLEMIKEGVFDKGLVSLLQSDIFDEWATKPGNEEYKTLIKDKYPFVIDYEDEKFVSEMHNFFTQKEMWMQTYFSVVSETSPSDSWIFITEKSIRPILYYHPFIIWGNPGTLEILKNFGFETFPEFFDESYDLIEDKDDRLSLIMENIKNLCNTPLEKIHTLYQSVIPKLIHNKKTLMNLENKKLEIILNLLTSDESYL